MRQHTLADPDMAWLYRIAGDAAADRSQLARAIAVYERSEREWRRVGRTAEADAVAREARALGASAD